MNNKIAWGSLLFLTLVLSACGTIAMPVWQATDARAAMRVDGMDAAEYIRTSIVNPGAYVVEMFPDGLMPQNWAEI